MKNSLVLCLLMLSGCAAWTSAPDSLQISGFQSGLVAFDGMGNAFLSTPGIEFPYAANGRCRDDKGWRDCMWHGFEFSYDSVEANPRLQCVAESNRSQDIVVPGALLESNTTRDQWTFILPGKRGHYVRPQYTILARTDARALHEHSLCSYNGREVFSFDFEILATPPRVAQPVSGPMASLNHGAG